MGVSPFLVFSPAKIVLEFAISLPHPACPITNGPTIAIFQKRPSPHEN